MPVAQRIAACLWFAGARVAEAAARDGRDAEDEEDRSRRPRARPLCDRRGVRNLDRNHVPASSGDNTAATESSGYGAINSFDRSLDAIKERNDGARLAFVAAYSCSRCSGVMSVPGLTTAVQCDRQREAWSCDERELDEVATELGLKLTVDSDGGYTEQARDAVVRALLARP